MRKLAIIVIAVLVLVGLVVPSVFFTVKQTEYALVFKFGQWQRTETTAGLYAKIPLIEDVVYLPRRIQNIESNDTERIQTSEKKNLIINYFIKWHIEDPLQFYVSFGAGRAGMASADNRLTALIRDALNAAVNVRTVSQVLSTERTQVIQQILANLETLAKPLGINVVDVRFVSLGFSQEVSASVYNRMMAERHKEANALRAEGTKEAEFINAEADRVVRETLAQAQAQAQEIRGKADAQVTQIYAKAYGTDPAFFSFYNSLNAYQSSFNAGDVLILDSKNAFLQYFQQPLRSWSLPDASKAAPAATSGSSKSPNKH